MCNLNFNKSSLWMVQFILKLLFNSTSSSKLICEYLFMSVILINIHQAFVEEFIIFSSLIV